MFPIVAADRSDSATGRCPTIADVRVAGSNAWTMSVPTTSPPPKANSLPPIMAPAASWNAPGIEPSAVRVPVVGFSANTPDTDAPDAASPPARYTVPPSSTVISRWTGASSRYGAAPIRITSAGSDEEGERDGGVGAAAADVTTGSSDLPLGPEHANAPARMEAARVRSSPSRLIGRTVATAS